MNQTITTETLYRKYRPRNFDEIIGQSEVVDTLQNQINSGSIAHAYLFSGGRGTGKTSIARIFARELGCDEQDIYEIDAASNRGINEIREVRDGVANRPFASTYKVYIIDEVHMLTKEAFNALLKTLEEPPAHVIFVLATTEKHKVLDTILSRCQVYDFKLAIEDSLVELITRVAQEEKRTVDEESISYIAKMGNGSFRDTLSFLQKVLGNMSGNITIEELSRVFHISNEQLEMQLVQALSDKNQEQLFATYHKVIEEKEETSQIIDNLLELLRKVLLLRYDKQYRKVLENTMTEEKIAALESANGVTSHSLRDLLQTKQLVSQSERPQDSFEVFLYQQCEKWNK